MITAQASILAIMVMIMIAHDDHHTGLHPGEDQGVRGRLGEFEGGPHQHPWKYQVVHSGQQHFVMMLYVVYANIKMLFFKNNFATVITLTMISSRNEEEQLQKRGSESSEERREQEVRVIASPKKIFSVTEVTWR